MRECRISLEIYTPYAGAVGLLIHIKRKLNGIDADLDKERP
jgi:hypothetical protein